MTPQPDVLNPLQLEVMGILDKIPQEIAKYGYFSTSTCDTNAYGWSRLKHAAMEYIQRHPPDGTIVDRSVKFEVTDWKITMK